MRTSLPTDSPDTTDTMNPSAIELEIDRQVERLAAAGHLAKVGWSRRDAAAYVDTLRRPLAEAAAGLPGPTRERVPFVLVLPGLEPSYSITTQRLGTRAGFVSADTADIDDFRPIEGLEIPAGLYAAVDVRRGQEHLGRTPDEAMADFATEGRSPLTISEGLAFLTAHPQALEKNHCFQTPGSRNGDQRVPGLWISSRAPKLGFCWARNHHTWLGVASCRSRVAAS